MKSHGYKKALVLAGLVGALSAAPTIEAYCATQGWNNSNGNWTYIDETGPIHEV